MAEPISFLAAAAPGLAAGATNVAGGLIGQKRSYKYSKKLAAFQHQKNMEILKYQLDYNSPAQQMQRFRDAGLNENLIYGQGDAGNWSGGRPEYPSITPPDFSFLSGLGTQIAQAQLLKNQADLTKVKVDESTVKQELNKAQTDLVKANPYLKPEYIDSLLRSLKATADLKAQESSFMTGKDWRLDKDGNVTNLSRGWEMMETQMRMLEQKFNLNAADQRVKAEIIKSKEFANALDQIQVNWMKDGEITSQHIYQFLMMLVSKLAR